MSLETVMYHLFTGLGVALGIGLTVGAHTLWTILGASARELIASHFQLPAEPNLGEPASVVYSDDDAHRLALWNRIAPPIEQGETIRVLLSDLHIDTWRGGDVYRGTYPFSRMALNPCLVPRRLSLFLQKFQPIRILLEGYACTEPPSQNKEWQKRAVDFLELLRTLRLLSTNHRVELYINGDLTDIPLHAAHEGRNEPDELIFDERLQGTHVDGRTWNGVLPGSLDPILSALRNVVNDDNPRLRIFYLTGNHDVGITGLRYFRPDATGRPTKRTEKPFALLDLPAHVIWNPAVIIRGKEQDVYVEHGHLHDPILWLYMRYAVFDLLRGGFRHQERRLLGRMQRGKTGQNAKDPAFVRSHTTGSQPVQPPPPTGPAPWTKRFSFLLVKLRYRQAARETARHLRKHYGARPFTIVFGHTHIEDEMTFCLKGTPYRYINAGSWAGNQEHQTLWIVRGSGRVEGPLQWPP